MRIAVCVSLVPDTASPVSFVDGALEQSSVAEVINPYDEYAIEEALRCRERSPEGTVTLFSVLPASSAEVLRKGLAMGADEAFRVSLEGVVDPYRTACALREAIRSHYGESLPDLVLCGRHSVDYQEGQVPLLLGGLLGMVSLSAVSALEEREGRLLLEREIEGGAERFEVALPALLSIEKGLNVPRKTSIRGVMAARKKQIGELSVSVAEEPLVCIESIRPVERVRSCRFLDDPEELGRIMLEKGGAL